MVRASNGEDHPSNAGSNPHYRVPASCRCIAAGCAMWRWEYTTVSVPVTVEGAGAEQARTFEQRVVRTHGYCGLAGAPTS